MKRKEVKYQMQRRNRKEMEKELGKEMGKQIAKESEQGSCKRIVTRLMAGMLIGGLFVEMLSGCGGSEKAASADVTMTAEVENEMSDTTQEVETTETPAEETVEEAVVEDLAPSEEAALEDASSVEGAVEESEKVEDGYVEIADMAVATGGTKEAMKMADVDVLPIQNTEEYSESEEKGFVSVYSEPLSTFSADVDTASYSNLRRLIREGYGVDELPEGAVRIEEMINYFSYQDLNEPKAGEPFGVTTQIMPCPWNADAQLLRIGLKTEEVDYEAFPASNLVFLLDVSGSMYADDKLPLLQESFAVLAENLTKKDRVSIVTYAGDDAVIIEGVPGNETKKICQAIYALEAGGSTHGSKGIETAYRLAEEYFIEDGNNRVILATDGDLNVGLTTEEELEELITEKKESGVFLSVLGFGTGNLKDSKMEILADKGNGNYAYIDSLREANKVLVEEMSATLLTVCKDVKFQVEFNPAVVQEYRLIGYDNRRMAAEDFDDDTKDAGEIGAGHCVTALYEIVTNETVHGRKTKELKYAEFYEKEGYEGEVPAYRQAENEWLTISIRYKEPEGSESMLLEYPVDASSYTQSAGDDFLFVAAVAEFGLAAKNSAYKSDASLQHVEEVLESMDLNDEYKKEFRDLVHELQSNS